MRHQSTDRGLAAQLMAVWEMARLSWLAGKWLVVLSIFLTSLRGVQPVAIAWAIKLILDYLATDAISPASAQGFPKELLIVLAVYGLSEMAGRTTGTIAKFLNSDLRRKTSQTVASTIYGSINRFAGIAHFEDPRFRDSLQVGTEAANVGVSSLIGETRSMLEGLFSSLTFLASLLGLAPYLATLVLISSIPELLIQLHLNKERFSMLHDVSPLGRRATYHKTLLTDHNSVKEIKLFRLGSRILSGMLDSIERIHSIQRVQELREARIEVGLTILSSATSILALFFVIGSVIEGRLGIGDLAFFIQAIPGVQRGLRAVVFGTAAISRNALMFTSFKKVNELPETVHISPRPVGIRDLSTAIEFQNVWFRYPQDSSWVLNGVNMTIPKSESIALFGSNGSGKTTLVKLLTRLYDPDRGKILWDGIDIRKFDVNELRSKIGVVFQDFVKFSFSVRDNIGFGAPGDTPSDQSIMAAATLAGINEKILSLHNGYSTVLDRTLSANREGTFFSEGEWQKLAIARLLMHESDVFVLDEPTSHLDPESESETFQRFLNPRNKRTCIIISHQLNVARKVDRIAVLQNGKVTEYASYEGLMKDNLAYSKLIEHGRIRDEHELASR